MSKPKDPKEAKKPVNELPNLDGPEPPVDPDWIKKLYTPERIKAHAAGKITTAQLHAVTWYEILDIANRAFSFFNEGRYKEAGTLFRGLIVLEPKEAYYRLGLGAVYLAEDHLDAARQLFEQAIKLNPKEIAAYVNRGECFLRLGQLMDAALDFQKAIELDPEGKEPITQRARVLAAAALETAEASQPSGRR